MFTANEAKQYDNAINVRYQIAVRAAEINAYSEEANEAMRMQNPVYLRLKGIYWFNPASSIASATNDYSKGNYKEGTLHLALGAFALLGKIEQAEKTVENAAKG